MQQTSIDFELGRIQKPGTDNIDARWCMGTILLALYSVSCFDVKVEHRNADQTRFVADLADGVPGDSIVCDLFAGNQTTRAKLSIFGPDKAKQITAVSLLFKAHLDASNGELTDGEFFDRFEAAKAILRK